MAECNYDEVTHSVYPPENPDPMYHWDAHFPERLSRLHLNVEYLPSCPAAFLLRRRTGNGSRRPPRDRCSGRYKTQPITFDEIAEVDDDDDNNVMTSSSSVTSQNAEPCREARASSFRGQGSAGGPGFFSRSVDGLVGPTAVVVSGFRPQMVSTAGGSDKENTPCRCHDNNDGRKLGGDELPAAAVPAFPFFDASGSGGDVTRHRRKRSGRRLRNRNSVPEEEAPDAEKMAEQSTVAAE